MQDKKENKKMNELIEKLLVAAMTDPDGAIEEVGGYIEKYKPVAYKALKYFVDIYADYVNNRQWSGLVAKAKRNMFDAYVGVGFTEDQAMALLLNDNIRLMENIKKTSNSTSKSRSSK